MITRMGATHWSGRKSGKFTPLKRLFLLFGVFEQLHVFREGIFRGRGSERETLRKQPSVLGECMNGLCCAVKCGWCCAAKLAQMEIRMFEYDQVTYTGKYLENQAGRVVQKHSRL